MVITLKILPEAHCCVVFPKLQYKADPVVRSAATMDAIELTHAGKGGNRAFGDFNPASESLADIG
jgi:hypothetical protein